MSPLTIGLGLAIRVCRRERDLTQGALGTKSEIHSTWISHIETGRVNPTLGNVARIAGGLGMKTSELIARAEDLTEQEP